MDDVPDALKEEVESELGKHFEWDKLEKGLNTIYVISSGDEEYVLKVHTNPKNEIEWFRAEPEIYTLISRELNIPSPKIVYQDLSQNQVGDAFYVMEKMPGKNPEKLRDEFKQQDVESIISQFGKILGKIHQVKLSDEYGIQGFEDKEFHPPEGSEQWNWSLEGAMSSWKDIIQDEWENPPEINYNSGKIKQILPNKPDPVLVHSDNRFDNLLIEQSQITGFLDWSHPWSGHKIYDLVRAEYLLIEWDLDFWEEEYDQQKLKESLHNSYMQEIGFEPGADFEEICQVYRYATTLWLAAGFANWGESLKDKEWENMRKEILNRLEEEQKEFLSI